MPRLLHVDADACFLDGRPVVDWLGVLDRLGEVDGAFTLAWEDDTGALNLARDAIGHRSLFWTRDATGVRYSPRLHTLVRQRPEINLDAMARYLAYAYVPGEDTLVRGIHAVAAGTRLRFGATVEVERFWSLPADPPRWDSHDELQPRLRAELERAVGQVTPDEPCAATLSGGIDSSLVVALARPARTLSISFGPEHRNELEWSSMVARHCGVAHEVVEVTPEDIRRDFDRTVGALSEPNGDPLTVPNLLLFRAAGGGVVFNGEGGDPCFGGPKNGPMLLASLYGDVSKESAYLQAHQRCFEDLDDMLVAPAPDLEPMLAAWFGDPRWPTFLNRLMAINIAFKGAWHILPKVEHLGALHGVRARSPLFSRRIVELSTRLPGSAKRSGSIEKHLLKEAVRDLLPAAIIDRPKSGMMVPVEAWFSGPLLPWARERLLDATKLHGLIHRSWLERLLDRRLGGLRPRRGIKIWQCLTLESWLRSVEDAWKTNVSA